MRKKLVEFYIERDNFGRLEDAVEKVIDKGLESELNKKMEFKLGEKKRWCKENYSWREKEVKVIFINVVLSFFDKEELKGLVKELRDDYEWKVDRVERERLEGIRLEKIRLEKRLKKLNEGFNK